MIIPPHCTSPPNIRIQNRQTRNRKREADPAVKAKIAAWVIGKYCSCGCGHAANMAHHPKGELYETDERYLNLDECEPYWSPCHHKHHKGYVRCPECKGWMRAGREKCAKCSGWTPDSKRRIRKGRPHSCQRHGADQLCSRSSYRCTFSSRKAPGCLYFLSRKGKVKA